VESCGYTRPSQRASQSEHVLGRRSPICNFRDCTLEKARMEPVSKISKVSNRTPSSFQLLSSFQTPLLPTLFLLHSPVLPHSCLLFTVISSSHFSPLHNSLLFTILSSSQFSPIHSLPLFTGLSSSQSCILQSPLSLPFLQFAPHPLIQLSWLNTADIFLYQLVPPAGACGWALTTKTLHFLDGV
jgi:hypothetical protein